MTDFNQPGGAGGAYVKVRDLLGHLILVTTVHDVQYDLPNPTFGGTRDVATVDLVDLDDDEPVLQTRMLIDKKHIVSRLTAGDTNVLARVGQVDTGKGNPALVLDDHDQDDAIRARAWLDRQRTGGIGQPTPAKTPPPAASPTPKPATAPAVTPGPDLAAVAAALGNLTPEQRAALGF